MIPQTQDLASCLKTYIAVLLVQALFITSMATSCDDPNFNDDMPVNGSCPAWISTLKSLCWIAYSPTNFDPELGIVPNRQSISRDLSALRDAGFSGLVTYGCDIMEDISQLPIVADSLGFEGIVLGVWNPEDTAELMKCAVAASHDLVVGICVGNEGLQLRYDVETLQHAMTSLRVLTGKAVTTSEELLDYDDESVMGLGDWIFPNAHPYWSGIKEPSKAVEWTVVKFKELQQRTVKTVVFKEVGLPTLGDESVTESAQMVYYDNLAETQVKFVYFEAFDQPWKKHKPVEPYWGIFRSDRTPKPASRAVCGSL